MTEQSTPELVEPVTEALVASVVPLNAHDRCDKGKCGAQAYVRVNLLDGDLVFCSHHFNENEAALLPFTVTVQDEREKMNVKPSQSSV